MTKFWENMRHRPTIINTQPITNTTQKTQTIPKTEIAQENDEFVKEQEKFINKRRGLIAGFYDKVKSLIGYGSNKKQVGKLCIY